MALSVAFLYFCKKSGNNQYLLYCFYKKFFYFRNMETIDEEKKIKMILSEMFARCSTDYYNGTLDKKIADEINELFNSIKTRNKNG
jgi:hypothetical protein